MIDDAVRRLSARASALFRSGDTEQAIAAYRMLLRACPDLPDSWYNLGILYRRARQPDAALAAYAVAIDHGVSGVEEVHVQRGVIYAEDLSDPEAARRELGAALAVAPQYLAALLNLGNLEEDLGNRSAAQQAYARALEADSSCALALARLVGVADLTGHDDPLIRRVHAMLLKPELIREDRLDLGFALGSALDGLGAYDDAFQAYAAANGVARAIATDAGSRYDRHAMEAFVDDIIGAFSRPAPVADVKAPIDGPIFIAGMFRSGSTLAEHLMARHFPIRAGGEIDLLQYAIATRFSPYPIAAVRADGVAVAAAQADYMARACRRLGLGKSQVFTDKRPDNVWHLGLAKRMFPGARIIHTVRAPLDTCLSVYFLHADPMLAYATDLEDIAHCLLQERRIMAHWQALYPNDIFTLDYDRLVVDPDPVLAELSAFLGFGGQVGAGDLDPATTIRTASAWQVRKPIYRSSSGRARHYSRYLGGMTHMLDQGHTNG